MQISLLMYLLMVATSVFFLCMAEFFKRQGEKYQTSKQIPYTQTSQPGLWLGLIGVLLFGHHRFR